MSFFGQSRMANPRVIGTILPLERTLLCVENPVAIWIVDHIIKITDLLLANKIPQNIDIAIGLRIRRENLMVRYDHNLLAIPDLRRLAELALENADGPRATNIVGHKDIRLHPDIVTSLHLAFAAGSRENLLCQCHKRQN